MNYAFTLSAQTQYKHWNGYSYTWKYSKDEPTRITVHAPDFDVAQTEARKVLRKLPSDWRYVFDQLLVEPVPDYAGLYATPQKEEVPA